MNEREQSRNRVSEIEERVRDHWQDSDEVEARALIKAMIENPSPYWFEIVFKAEKKQIAHWQLILENFDELTSAAANAVADEDGMVDY
jgi:hypothetical protein